MNISEQESRYREIETAMVFAQRSSWRGIRPGEIVGLLPAERSEKQVRQDIDILCKMGRLVRVGSGLSRGYRLATAAQRSAFTLKYGMRPRGEISVSEYTELVYEAIENAVAKAYRDLGRGVLPRDIQARLPYDRAEGSLRRDMLAMYSAGRLVRVAGHGARQGYRLPHVIEKLAFAVNGGMWPYGTESVVTWA